MNYNELSTNKQINMAMLHFEVDKVTCTDTELVCFHQRIGLILSKLQSQLDSVERYLCTTDTSNEETRRMFSEAINHCMKLVERFGKFDFHPVKPRKADFTDAGPGVSVTNTDVKFRDAEIAIIHNLDYRIRCHRSRGDSGQGEAERTNSAIGDALVEGATINWEHTKRFEGMSEDEIQSMSLKEYECYEEMRMQSNAWYVSKIIQERIQDAPVLNEYISSFVSDKPNEMFFPNQDLLHESSQKSSESAKDEVPGANYFKKILDFWKNHYKSGQLFMEFIKGGCLDVIGELCWHCKSSDWIGARCSRISQPMPDLENPMHYLDVFATPLVDTEGKARKPDDFQPRVCITKAFKEGEISLENRQAIQTFALALACEEKHVVNCIQHIKDMEIRKEKRSREREAVNQTSKMKLYKGYNWLGMTKEGTLKSLKVKELDKYLDHHRLSKKARRMTK